jgi:hypothetical protein
MIERRRPIPACIKNAGDDAIGVGAAVVLGHRPGDKLVGKVEPPKLKKLAGALCQNLLRERTLRSGSLKLGRSFDTVAADRSPRRQCRIFDATAVVHPHDTPRFRAIAYARPEDRCTASKARFVVEVQCLPTAQLLPIHLRRKHRPVPFQRQLMNKLRQYAAIVKRRLRGALKKSRGTGLCRLLIIRVDFAVSGPSPVSGQCWKSGRPLGTASTNPCVPIGNSKS